VANLLFLVHRMPYPPNKGDKVRSYHLLKHMSAKHRVFVGTFLDDPDDEQHLPTLRALCAGLHVTRLHGRRARIASLAGLATGDALTLHYYRNAALARWVAATVRNERIDAVIVFSSSMAQYATAHPELPMLVDFVDVDSAKWTDYAPNHRWPLSWLYAREGRRLLAYEREVAARSRCAFFATEKEAELFCGLAPECRDSVLAMNNGVDADFFAPDAARVTPFLAGETPLVFTGAMDYWPNIDAVTWFAANVLPRLRQQRPNLRLHIVGRSPAPAVRALAGDAVAVTGTVADVRPYLQHAAVVVAPLRLARGIQNKILEAMAMARPVVAATACVDALSAEAGAEILPAAEADDYVRNIDALLASPDRAAAIGTAGRQRVLTSYAWQAHLTRLDEALQSLAITTTEPLPAALPMAAKRVLA
jgi:polysaccharide biosynthesis protein PslH